MKDGDEFNPKCPKLSCKHTHETPHSAKSVAKTSRDDVSIKPTCTTDNIEKTPAATAGQALDKCKKSLKDHNTSSSNTSSGSYPEHWEYQQFKSKETEFILLGKGSHRDKLYKYKSKLKTNIENILDLHTSENYLTLE